MVQEKILVIQTAFPGDAILTLPLIEELFKKFNSPLIDVICTPLTQQIFDASEFVNKSIALDKRGKHKSLVEMTRFALKIRNSKYSKIVSPHRSFRTSYIVMLSGVKDSTGFDVSSCSFVYKFKKRYGFDYHEVQRNLSLIDEFYVEGDNWKILPKISSDEKISEKAAGEIIEKGKRGVVAIAPGSVWETKKYPQKYFSEIACNLKKENYSVVLIGGKEDFELNEEIKSECSSNIFNLAGSLKIVESINFLRKCSLLICNDSAPTHMGMIADIPVLTLYCSTVSRFGFYPYNNKSEYLSFDDLECKPCGIHGRTECPLKTFDCGWKLTPEIILNKAYEMLNR